MLSNRNWWTDSCRTIARSLASHCPTRDAWFHRIGFSPVLSFTVLGRFCRMHLVHKGMTMKVFIVDDSRVVVERLAGLLEEVPGARLVGQAGDVGGAVVGIQKVQPDALILDLHIPGGSGLDVL